MCTESNEQFISSTLKWMCSISTISTEHRARAQVIWSAIFSELFMSTRAQALTCAGAQKIEKKIYCCSICTRIGRIGRLSDAVFGMYCFLRLCWRVEALAFGLSPAQLVLIDVNRNFDIIQDTRYYASMCFLRPLLHFIEDECLWIWFSLMA